MGSLKTKSLENIEQKMKDMDEGSLRYKVLGDVKNFKTSWIDLAQALYSVWKDKLYKSWGYQNFDTYTTRELGLRKQTAMKLLRSYYFLEKEEPAYLRKDYAQATDAALLPGYESIDALRLAKNKKILDENDYAQFKRNVFEKGKDAKEIKKDLTSLIRQRQELDPEGARQKRKAASVKRFISVLKSLKKNLEVSKMLPAAILKDAQDLIEKLEGLC